MILVDTSVWIDWSNDRTLESAAELDRLLETDQVATTDFVMAELLQGSRTQQTFNDWVIRFTSLHFYEAPHDTWLRAAALSFQLIRGGLTTSLSDLVIAQVAIDNALSVFATDPDFERVPGLVLHKAGA